MVDEKVIIEELMLHPERANAWIAKDLGVGRGRVAQVRIRLEVAGELKRVETFVNERGRAVQRRSQAAPKQEAAETELLKDASRSNIEIANLLGVGRQAVAIARKRLEVQGLIDKQKQEVSQRFKLRKVGDKYQVMPDPSPELYEALKEDIRQNGIRDAILVDSDGNVIDGHTRLRIRNELLKEGVEIRHPGEVLIEGLSDIEKRTEARRKNAQRRQLNPQQLNNVIKAQLRDTPTWANIRIATMLGCHFKRVRGVRIELEKNGEIEYHDRLEYLDKHGAMGLSAPRSEQKKQRERKEQEKQSGEQRHGCPQGSHDKTPKKAKPKKETEKKKESEQTLGEMVESGKVDLSGIPSGNISEELQAYYDYMKMVSITTKLTVLSAADVAQEVVVQEKNLEAIDRHIEILKDHGQGLTDLAAELTKARSKGLTAIEGGIK